MLWDLFLLLNKVGAHIAVYVVGLMSLLKRLEVHYIRSTIMRYIN